MCSILNILILRKSNWNLLASNAGCGGRKGKFGLNCQAVSDVRGRILDLSIGLPGASSDCIAFEGSDLYERLEGGLLKNGLVLFGDNVYL